MRVKIVHIITGLATGGAERMLLKLLSHSDSSRFEHLVVSLSTTGPIADEIRGLGITVVEVGLKHGGGIGTGLAAMRHVASARPQILQGWMPHGNVAARLCKLAIRPRPRVIWNIRQTIYDLALEKSITRLLIRFGGLISGHADRIIYNSTVGMAQHTAVGYSDRRALVIPNGFETAKFVPNHRARQALRKLLAIEEGEFLVGHVARFHPMKDHGTFFQGFAEAARSHAGLRAVVAGPGCGPGNAELSRLVAVHGIEARVNFLDECENTADLYPALDALCLTSAWGEGFPNTVGEAMSCEVPCIATDVGDAAALIGDTGFLVHRQRPDMLADALGRLRNMTAERRKALGASGRERIARDYDIRGITRSYESLYEEVLQDAV